MKNRCVLISFAHLLDAAEHICVGVALKGCADLRNVTDDSDKANIRSVLQGRPVLADRGAERVFVDRQRNDGDRLREIGVGRRAREEMQVLLASILNAVEPRPPAAAPAEKAGLEGIGKRERGAAAQPMRILAGSALLSASKRRSRNSSKAKKAARRRPALAQRGD